MTERPQRPRAADELEGGALADCLTPIRQENGLVIGRCTRCIKCRAFDSMMGDLTILKWKVDTGKLTGDVGGAPSPPRS